MTTKVSFCRICSGGCGTVLTLDALGAISSIRGDRNNSLSQGYACFKGLRSGDSHHGPERLLRPLERLSDGSRQELGLESALDGIARKLNSIIDRHGPNAVAVFCGNGAVLHPTAFTMQRSFLSAIGSAQFFTTLTIDQSAKVVTFGRLGAWSAGMPEFDDMDVALLFGTNPLISHSSLGFLSADPVNRLRAAKARGLKLITVDPRRTETAIHADLALQPFPGQDPAIAGGLIRLILQEGWEDIEFCERYVGQSRMADLRKAVEPLVPELVEARAGLIPGQLRAVAEMFARDRRTGCAYGATGPNMAPFSNLAQHLIECLNVICGRFLREGQAVRRMIIQDPPTVARAQVIAAGRQWENDGKSRIRGFNSLFGERLTGTLADEILTPGEGQIKALIVDGGDPAVSLPDHSKAIKALQSLDLLVTIEPFLGPTAKLAHYILPPLLQYERADISAAIPGYPMWPGAWAQYTPPAIKPPEGADLADDWYMFWSLAKRLGRTITYAGKTALDMKRTPTTDDLIAIQLEGSRSSLEILKSYPHGHDFELDGSRVEPAEPGSFAVFDVMPGDVAEELHAFHVQGTQASKAYDFLLSTRRLRDFFNSNGIHNKAVRARNPYNPAYFNPQDMAALRVTPGEIIELSSDHGSVRVVAEEDSAMRCGVISLAHGWGEAWGEAEEPRRKGSCVNKLTDTVTQVESINAMPHISAIPVNVRRVL